jgi:hypothetical protein
MRKGYSSVLQSIMSATESKASFMVYSYVVMEHA